MKRKLTSNFCIVGNSDHAERIVCRCCHHTSTSCPMPVIKTEREESFFLIYQILDSFNLCITFKNYSQNETVLAHSGNALTYFHWWHHIWVLDQDHYH